MPRSKFLMGLGIGMILGAVFLQLMIIGQQVKEETSLGASLDEHVDEVIPSQAITEEQLRALAAEHHFKLIPENETWYSPQQFQLAVSEELVKRQEELEHKLKTGFVIEEGMTAEEVANMLWEEGWIETTDEFLILLKQEQLFTKIQAGEYDFVQRPSLEQIVEIITSKSDGS